MKKHVQNSINLTNIFDFVGSFYFIFDKIFDEMILRFY